MIDKLAEQIALSQRKGVRESAASVVITFITTYPLGEKRMTSHMKQMVTNCSYAYEDGRHSSFDALAILVRLLPLPLLEDHSLSIFLPMTLRLVSTVSKAEQTIKENHEKVRRRERERERERERNTMMIRVALEENEL